MPLALCQKQNEACKDFLNALVSGPAGIHQQNASTHLQRRRTRYQFLRILPQDPPTRDNLQRSLPNQFPHLLQYDQSTTQNLQRFLQHRHDHGPNDFQHRSHVNCVCLTLPLSQCHFCQKPMRHMNASVVNRKAPLQSPEFSSGAKSLDYCL